ncbi:DNA-binding transcriptional regulator, AcrR family [Terribacillus halophilus]|uniref:DNA-binding transcriptional regulator, AcrR family n=1 Tax=Terribacillus halophilus TaxID=361279 RepID=A0A1G6MWU8_9BACI|nr:TetR-like C-terminal domain-containing protein [Terribacillus halophilus]SDC60009.1 DNA-binding transcriptional regulator, AcrR family [Terribacillus halophilus]
MNKNDLRILKTKQNIHLALTKLLKKKALPHIKVTELCREANINRGTFYFHYQEVGDVFKEYYEEVVMDLKESYNEPYRHTVILDPKNLNPKTVRIFHHIKKYEEFYRIILSKEVPLEFYLMLFDEIRSILMEDKHAVLPKEIKDYLYSYSANAIIGLIIEWYRRDFQESADEMNVLLVNILRLKV